MDNSLFDENARLVVQAANQSWEEALDLPAGTEERSSAMADAEKTQSHVEKLIDANNRAAEMEARLEAEENDREQNRTLELEKFEESKKNKKTETIVRCTELGVTTAVTLWCCRSQLKTYWDSLKLMAKFEETGSFLTAVGKTTANKFGQILKFK